MLAIASLLDPINDEQIKGLWRLLEEKCGLTGIQETPSPHFSWIGCEDMQLEKAHRRLEKIGKQIGPFKIKTAGLGIFPGRIPVLYISIVKTAELMKFHRLIWKELEKYLIVPTEYYRPDRWMPHITIAYGDLNPDNLACALHDLAFEAQVYDIDVDNIAVMYHTEEGIGIKERFQLE